MNPTIASILAANHTNGAKAAVIEEINENLMYVGYCSPECTGYNDAKWRIEKIQTQVVSGVRTQTIFYANGTSAMTNVWNARASYLYAPTKNWK